MKRFLTSGLLLVGSLAGVLCRADVIVMQDGIKTLCKVIRISESEITYTLPGQNVERTVGKASVFKIQYDNGANETITSIRAAAVEEEIVLCTGVKPTFQTDYSHLPPASRAYELFDYYNENGVEGIVVEVADGGRHGKIIALRENKCKFAEDNVIEPFSTGCTSLADGETNCRILSNKLAANSTLSVDDFPAHKWASSLGAGWYIPSYGEMLRIVWLFETKDTSGKSMKKLLNRALKSRQGTPIAADLYGTSSECEHYAIYKLTGYGLMSSWTPTYHSNGIYAFGMKFTKDIVKSTETKEGTSRYKKMRFRALHKF